MSLDGWDSINVAGFYWPQMAPRSGGGVLDSVGPIISTKSGLGPPLPSPALSWNDA